MREEIIEFFKDISPDAYHLEDAAYVMGFTSAKALNEYMMNIKELLTDGTLMTKDGTHLYYRKQSAEEEASKKRYEGIFKTIRNGSGFVAISDTEEIFIGIKDKMTAMNNDRVEIVITKAGTAERKGEGRIVRIIERSNLIVVGTFAMGKNYGFVVPDDERLGTDIYIPSVDHLDIRSGAKVAVEITKWPEKKNNAEGKITEILGYTGDMGLDILSILAQHQIPRQFPPTVLAEADQISMATPVTPERLDLRHIPMVTIDGEDAKDLDDAVHGAFLPNGNFELGVHIADVSHYVKPKTALDKEAYNRGTSVYVVDRVVPMLPTVLSNGICSLNAGEDRYAMSCIMEINKEGKVVRHKISPSVIHVARRCSYTEVYQALEEDIIPESLAPHMDMLHTLKDIAMTLMNMRFRRGAINFDFPEYKVVLDASGTPLSIVKRERTIAHQLIEECMLIANETVATFLKNTNKPSMYRIHEDPRPEKLETVKKVLSYGGLIYRWPAEITSSVIQHMLDTVAGTDIESIAQVMTLRSMQQAKYSADNVGHFGLASTCYTHFTSPIRRYPDLIVHRLLKEALGLHEAKVETSYTYMMEAASHCSETEERATQAERDTQALKKVELMATYVGDVFEGRINSITNFGMFVELDNGVDGLVPLALMTDDHYNFDEDHYVLVGSRTGKIFKLGQPVTVTLVKADVEKQQLDFMLGEVDLLRMKSLTARKPSGFGSLAKPERKKKKHSSKKGKGKRR